jgi:hypothetical protein
MYNVEREERERREGRDREKERERERERERNNRERERGERERKKKRERESDYSWYIICTMYVQNVTLFLSHSGRVSCLWHPNIRTENQRAPTILYVCLFATTHIRLLQLTAGKLDQHTPSGVRVNASDKCQRKSGTIFTNLTKLLIGNPANFLLAPLSGILPLACPLTLQDKPRAIHHFY